MNWSAQPFVRILFYFIVGILISKFIPGFIAIDNSILLIAALLLLVIATFIAVKSLKHKFSQISGVLFGLLITMSGILITSQNTLNNQIVVPNIDSQSYLANVINNPTETKQSVKAILSVTPVTLSSSQHSEPIKVLCYFAKDTLSSNLRYGDVIMFHSKLTVPNGPLNPYEFDYGSYLLQNGIQYTSYVNINNWKLVDYDPVNPIIAMAGKIRFKLLSMLSQNGLEGNDFAVAAAILLGYDDYMENDIKQDYIMAGSMHILCVSGLHVGIIFLVISYFLGFLQNNRFNNVIKAIVLAISVWAYATVTGLSPSVQRASLMLSVFILGNMLNRNRNTYNTLAISALILLIINPLLIFNVGFQLSYAAVIGIVTFHQPIYNLVYFKNSFVDKVWSITVLSFTAQLATFPIATYYFHFFPPWFWLTNLFTFPLSFFIIATGLVFVLTYWIPFLPQIVGWSLSGMIFMLNYIVGFVKFLPFSGIDYIYTSVPMLILIYLFIILTFIMLSNKKLYLLMPVMLVVALIIGLSTYHEYNIINQKRFVIYSVNKHSVYDFIDGDNHVLLSDSTLVDKTLDYQLKNSRAKWGIDDVIYEMPTSDTVINNNLSVLGDFILFEDLKLLIVDGNERYYPTNTKMQLDLLIISGNKKVNVTQLLAVFDIGNVVLDSSVPYWNQKSLVSMFRTEGVNCHNVSRDGAFMLEL